MTPRAPASPPRSSGADVQVRLVLLDVSPADVAAARSRLTPSELQYADRGTAAVRDRRVLLRAALRQLAGELLGLPPTAVPLADPPGRPTLTGAAAGRLDLSCSASGRLGLVAAVAGRRIGVDLERTSPEADLAAEPWLTADELAALAALPADRRPAGLARCWTGKEAVLKGTGTGLRADPLTVDTTRPDGWDLHPLDVPDGWVATLAVRQGHDAAAAAGPRTFR